MSATTDMMNQAAWIAFDIAFKNAGGTDKGKEAHDAGMRARARVHLGPVFEGPAEEQRTFSMRSTMRIIWIAACALKEQEKESL